MNAVPRTPGEPELPQNEPLQQSPQPRPHRVRNLVVFGALWTVVVLIAMVGIAAWVASTDAFQNRVRRALVAELQKSTGGRVELQKFSWRLSHLEFEADNLTIHGLEAADQIPYAHIDRLFVRLQILSFFRAKIGLNYLEADRPVLHLIVYPDGSTNQPKPKQASTGSSTDSIFDLAIGRTVVDNGIAIFNQRAIPINLTASNLAAQVSYVPLRDRYVGTLHVEDIVTQRGADLPVHSIVDASVEVGRNSANLVSLTLQSGPQGKSQKTVLRANGTLDNFAAPHWQFGMKGAIDALEVRALTGVPGLDGGTAQLEASGQGAGSQFAVNGNARISGGLYRIGTVNAGGITADAIARITQDQIAVTGIHARLATGGVMTGEMRIANWQAPAPTPGQPGTPRRSPRSSREPSAPSLPASLSTRSSTTSRRAASGASVSQLQRRALQMSTGPAASITWLAPSTSTSRRLRICPRMKSRSPASLMPIT